MSTGRNWDQAHRREQALFSAAEQRAMAAHLREIGAASGGRRAEPLDKSALRRSALEAVAQFAGKIRRCPAQRRGRR
jgi:hypothetical protein